MPELNALVMIGVRIALTTPVLHPLTIFEPKDLMMGVPTLTTPVLHPVETIPVLQPRVFQQAQLVMKIRRRASFVFIFFYYSLSHAVL
jgi:hypothetical protein